MIITHTNEYGAIHIEDSNMPQPYPSWRKIYNGLGFFWDAPVPCPQDDKTYIWNETILNWEEYNA